MPTPQIYTSLHNFSPTAVLPMGVIRVAQHVAFGDEHRGRWEIMERGADRRGAWRRAAAVAAEINAPEPPHLLGAEHIARAAISAVGRTIAAIVEGAVIEQQRLDRIALAGIAQVDRRRQGQIRADRKSTRLNSSH